MRAVYVSATAFLAAFALLVAMHWTLLSLPYFWDELGQFVPAALDILNTGSWVPRTTTPNVHPPLVMAYLALTWRVFGQSIEAARVAMLAFAALGLTAVFFLARRLGASPPWTVAILFASPIVFTQSMLAQLDMPAMALTAVALVLFLDRRYGLCAVACVLLVLTKETSAVAPVIFGAWLLREKRRREALYFAAPILVLAGWILFLKNATGNALGGEEFAQYNVGYALHPARVGLAVIRRINYLFFAEFRWIGTLGLLWLLRERRGQIQWRGLLDRSASGPWTICVLFAILQTLAVTLLGGATLERYLLPVLPILAAGFALIPNHAVRGALVAGLAASLWVPPPYPFPFENNLAIVDFVRLQQNAASYLEDNAPAAKVATAWPLTGALWRPALGYVKRPMAIVEMRDFRASTFDTKDATAVVVFTRVWPGSLTQILEPLLRRFYEYDTPISAPELAARGFRLTRRWTRGGQSAEVYLQVPR